MSDAHSNSGIHQIYSMRKYNEWVDYSKKTERPLVIKFTATWCGPCKAIAPTYADQASKHAETAVFLEVDVDESEKTGEPETLPKHFEVTAMPTFVIVKNGKEVDRLLGANKSAVLSMFKKHL